MSANPIQAVRVVQGSSLPGTLDEFVSNGPAFEFFQWGLSEAPTSEKIDVYRMDVIHHYTDPELKRVMDITVQITNKESGKALDLSITRSSAGRFIGFYNGKIADIGELPAFFDTVADLPKSSPPPRTYGNIHEHLKARIADRSQGIKTSFEDDEPDTGFKL